MGKLTTLQVALFSFVAGACWKAGDKVSEAALDAFGKGLGWAGDKFKRK